MLLILLLPTVWIGVDSLMKWGLNSAGGYVFYQRCVCVCLSVRASVCVSVWSG